MLLLLGLQTLNVNMNSDNKIAEASVTRDLLVHLSRTELAHLVTVLCWELLSHSLSITSVILFITTAPKVSRLLTLTILHCVYKHNLIHDYTEGDHH